MIVSIPQDDYIGEEEGAVEVCISLSSNYFEIRFNNILTLSTINNSGNDLVIIMVLGTLTPPLIVPLQQ